MSTPRAAEGETTVILDRVLPVIAFVLTVAALVSAENRVGQPGFEREVGDAGWFLAPVLGVLLTARKRAPLGILLASVGAVLAYYAIGEPAIGLELPLAAAFFSAAERGRTRAAALVAVGLVLVGYGYRIGVAGTEFVALLGLDLMTTVVVLALAITAGDGIRSRAAERAANAERIRLQAELVEENLRADTDAERRALARDVHDVLGHAMIVVSTQANVALEDLGDTEGTRSALTAIKSTAQQALRDIRGSIAVLAGDQAQDRHPVSTLADLGELAARFRGTGVAVEVTLDPRLGQVPAAVGSTAYRVVQESVTNAVRHGAARRVTVLLERAGDELAIAVGDDGRGAGEVVMGNGLRGMRDRVVMLGGELHAGPRAEGGFAVSARIPLTPAGRGMS